jgi:hypothetical protein
MADSQAPREHRYEVGVDWTGNDGAGTAGYRAYRRDHEISAGATRATTR